MNVLEKLTVINLYLIFTLNGTTKVTTEDVLKLNALKGTKTAFLTPKRYDEQPRHFYMGVPPPPGLTSSGLKAETERLIIAAQDQSLATRFSHSNIIKDGTSPLCRMCGKFDKSVDHIISVCPELGKDEYIQRHDNVASYIHWKVCQNYNIMTATKVRTQIRNCCRKRTNSNFVEYANSH